MTGPVVIEPEAVARRAAQVRQRIADAGGDPLAVTLLAVTKGFGPEVARAAVAAGLDQLGENYPQELAAKAAVVAGARWHAIGRLQRNKVRLIAPYVTLWQSVDSPRLGAEIARHAPGAEILVQVNVSEEPQKGGCDPEGTEALVGACGELGLRVSGLMTIGRTGSPDEARAGFAILRGLADDLALPIRSMGMSGDLEAAVAEGATMVRIGSSLFGPRPPRPQPGDPSPVG